MKYVNKKIICMIFSTFLLVSWDCYAIKIGVIVGQKKSVSSTSNAEKMCILENIYEHEKFLGKDIVLIFVENDRSARGSVEAALKLIEKDVDIVLLPLVSNEAEPAAELLTRNKIPFLTTATSDEVIKNSLFGLSLMPSNIHQSKLLAEYYIGNFPNRKIHIIVNKSSDYSIKMSNAFIHNLIEYRPETDFQEHTLYSFDFFDLEKLSDRIEDGDVIFTAIFNPFIAMLYNRISNLEAKNITIIGPDSIGGRTEFYEIIYGVDDNVDLIFLKNWDGKVKGPGKEKLISYVKAYCPDKKNTFLTTYSYDLINIILENDAILSNKVKRGEFIKELRKSKYVSAMDGAMYHFGLDGYNNKPMYLYKISSKGNVLLKKIILENNK